MRLSRPLSVKLPDILYMLSCAWKGRHPFEMLQPWRSYSDDLTLKGNFNFVNFNFTVLIMLKYLGHMTKCVIFNP